MSDDILDLHGHGIMFPKEKWDDHPYTRESVSPFPSTRIMAASFLSDNVSADPDKLIKEEVVTRLSVTLKEEVGTRISFTEYRYVPRQLDLIQWGIEELQQKKKKGHTNERSEEVYRGRAKAVIHKICAKEGSCEL